MGVGRGIRGGRAGRRARTQAGACGLSGKSSAMGRRPGTLAVSGGGRKCPGGGGQSPCGRGHGSSEWLLSQICCHPLHGTEQMPSKRLVNGGARGLQTPSFPSTSWLTPRETPGCSHWLLPSSLLLGGELWLAGPRLESASLVAAPVRMAAGEDEAVPRSGHLQGAA